MLRSNVASCWMMQGCQRTWEVSRLATPLPEVVARTWDLAVCWA